MGKAIIACSVTMVHVCDFVSFYPLWWLVGIIAGTVKNFSKMEVPGVCIYKMRHLPFQISNSIFVEIANLQKINGN